MEYVNAKQTKEERKVKYSFVRLAGYNNTTARKLRDWEVFSILRILSRKNNRFKKNGIQKQTTTKPI